MTEYVVRSWTKKRSEWTSEFDRFSTLADAEAHGRTHIRGILRDESDRGFEIQVTYGDTIFEYQYNGNGACIGQRNKGTDPGCFWSEWSIWGDDDTVPEEEENA